MRTARLLAIITLVLVAVLAVATPASAQPLVGRSSTYANLGDCLPGLEGRVAYVIDADAADDFGDGEGDVQVWARCLSSAWEIDEVGAVADLEAYVPIELAGQQVVEATGAGNDVSLIAADDVLLTPADALTVAAGGAASIVTTAGAVTITAGGTTQDVTVNSVDDVIFAATDDTTFAGDTVSIAPTTVAVNPGGSTVELTATVGEALWAAKVSHTAQAATCADSGDGSASTLSLAPTANVVTITNSDADGCDVTMSETGADAGSVVSIVVISNAGTTVNFADTAGVSEIAGAFAAAVQDAITLVYANSTWVELNRSNN